jgi:hypothetical protein
MFISKISLKVLSIIFTAAFVLAAGSEAFAAPTPFIWPTQNPSCATLNASNDPRVSHMTEDWELKLDPTSSGTWALVTAGNRQVINMTPNPNMFLTVALNASGTTMTSWSLTWNAPQNLDRLMSAIIVKGGNGGAHVYPYNPLDAGDAGSFVLPTGQEISHLSFCFEPWLSPSAGDASIRGKVLTAAGRPISGAVVTIVNLNTGETTNIVTGTHGTYAMKGLDVSNYYTVSVSARRYVFSDAARTFELVEDLAGFDFVAH